MKSKNKLKRRNKNRTLVKSKPVPWIELPRDLVADILGRLSAIDRLMSAQKVCSTWWQVCKDYPHMWRVIHMAESKARPRLSPETLQVMCCNAVYRSQGQLVDITIDGFCNDDLLRYISNRCSQLQCLRVVFSHELSSWDVLIEALKKFPMLNELCLFSLFPPKKIRSDLRDGYSVKNIVRSCPKLNTFTFTFRVDVNGMEPDDEDALAVAENLPHLRHLRLLGNGMTKEGVKAILDGCSNLESLDIRLCINAHPLSRKISERCRHQIKQVWLPMDSCSDHEYYDRLGELIRWVNELCESGYFSPGWGWTTY